MSAKRAEPLVMPTPPLRYRIPNEGPSPREYELIERQRVGSLTEAEAIELQQEQDTRTEWDAQWAAYREALRAYYAAQARTE